MAAAFSFPDITPSMFSSAVPVVTALKQVFISILFGWKK